ncbi:TPA: hypothetical protein ACH3X3_004821 [Trebouxia sp. C0006]
MKASSPATDALAHAEPPAPAKLPTPAEDTAGAHVLTAREQRQKGKKQRRADWKAAAAAGLAAAQGDKQQNPPAMTMTIPVVLLKVNSFTTGAPVPIERPATAEPAAFRAGQEPSPAAPSDATSIGDAQRPLTPKAQASGESPASGNRTSSGAGAAKTTPNGKGVAPGGKKDMVGSKQGPTAGGGGSGGGGATSNKTHHPHQLDPSSSEPQLDSGVDGPQVPTVPAAPAVTPSVPAVPDAPAVTPSVPAVPAGPAMPPSVPAAPDALNVPADAGGIAGGGVQTTREEKHKEKKRRNRKKVAAAKKAAADLAAADSTTASSAEQPGQAHLLSMYVQTTCMLLCRLMLSTLRLSMTELPLHLPRLLPLPQLRPAPVSLAEPADAGDITGGHVVPARQQKQKAGPLNPAPQFDATSPFEPATLA